ncbi:hypothetical protein [Georgenia alba]|uniref:LLM class flavin-dependent oxidoreductase n=1 Tax=Georgenia alba TaxID=2233858 RepID=A0ABW2QDQ6_9MICO
MAALTSSVLSSSVLSSSSTLSLLPGSSGPARYATLGLDLTGLGVRTDDLSDELPVEKADLARIASYTRAAHQAGVGLVCLDEAFRLRSDHAVRHHDWLDPLVAARRLAPHASAGLIAALPAGFDPDVIDGELTRAPHDRRTWTGLQVTGADAARLATRRRPTRTRPSRVVLALSGESDVELAGRYADVVRLREADPQRARQLRDAVRAEARSAGRKGAVTVLADVHTVVSSDRASAAERAALVADIAGEQAPWTGALTAYGTVADVADLLQAWLEAGAADGFVALPGSLPADVAGLVRGVVPELRKRGVLEDRPTAPVVSAPAAPAATETTSARARLRRAAAVA